MLQFQTFDIRIILGIRIVLTGFEYYFRIRIFDYSPNLDWFGGIYTHIPPPRRYAPEGPELGISYSCSSPSPWLQGRIHPVFCRWYSMLSLWARNTLLWKTYHKTNQQEGQRSVDNQNIARQHKKQLSTYRLRLGRAPPALQCHS